MCEEEIEIKQHMGADGIQDVLARRILQLMKRRN